MKITPKSNVLMFNVEHEEKNYTLYVDLDYVENVTRLVMEDDQQNLIEDVEFVDKAYQQIKDTYFSSIPQTETSHPYTT
jgi:hypothetical protein